LSEAAPPPPYESDIVLMADAGAAAAPPPPEVCAFKFEKLISLYITFYKSLYLFIVVIKDEINIGV
jgi:hypothetical protein